MGRRGILVVMLFLVSIFSTSIGEMEKYEARALQIAVRITSPPDGTVLHEKNVTVKGEIESYADTVIVITIEWLLNGEIINSTQMVIQPQMIINAELRIYGMLKLGANEIMLRVTDEYGSMQWDSITVYYEDITPPRVRIYNPEDGAVITTSQTMLEGMASDSYGSGIKELRWRIEGEEGQVTEDSVTFDTPPDKVTYSIPISLYQGENKITVSAQDVAGNVGEESITVWRVEELKADADGPYYGGVNEEIQFYGNATGGLPPYEWHWDFGDGSTSNEQNPKHSYSKAGNYTATLTVKDSLGNTAQDTAKVEISEELKADADGPYYGKVKEQIQFNGKASGGKPPYQWHWDFGDGSTSNEQNPKHSYSKAGNYIAKLTVTDSEGNKANDTAQVIVYEELKADADGPYGGLVGSNIQFFGSATGGVPPYQWQWNFGDGSFSNLQNPVHSYSMPGVYTATLTVTDSIGNVAQDSAFVYVFTQDNTPPSIKIIKPDKGLYMNNRKIMPLPLNMSIVIGEITVEVEASDDIAVAKVEFYLDDELKHTNHTAPYYWELNETIFGLHKLKAMAYDFAGHITKDEEKIVAVIKS